MLDRQRDRIASFLSMHQTCVVSTAGPGGAWATPARYRSLPNSDGGPGLDLECLLPLWVDAVYHVELDPRVLLIVQDTGVEALRWMELRGTAQPVTSPDWGAWAAKTRKPAPYDDIYRVLRVTPARIDLIDEGKGWGARETLEL